MYARNPLMLEKGLGPAADVARALNKSLSTVHRLVGAGKVVGARDGKALYIDLASAERYFIDAANPVMARICSELRGTLVKEGKKAAAQLARG